MSKTQESLNKSHVSFVKSTHWGVIPETQNSQKIAKEKELAKEILEKLSTIDSKCVLTGGAPRSWYFNKTANDLDFYIQYTADFSDSCARLSDCLGVPLEELHKPVKVETTPVDLYKNNPNIQHVMQFEYKSKTIQIICCFDKQKAVDAFPFGVCKGFMTNQGILIYPLEFLEEAEHNCLVLRNQMYQDGGGFIAKIKRYFPNWTYYEKELDFYKHIARKYKLKLEEIYA